LKTPEKGFDVEGFELGNKLADLISGTC